MYSEEDMLMLSGIQHIAFCERQWALIHIEQQWEENILTIEGQFMHERADDPFETEKRGNTITLRAVSLASFSLGLYGRADVIELNKTKQDDMNSITIKDYPGKWKPVPVEYKRGKPKPDRYDEVQLCAQAISLEEMYEIQIEVGYLYYGKTCHRQPVIFNDELRKEVSIYAARMHELYSNGTTPLPEYNSKCRSCSLFDLCMPRSILKKQSASEYIRKNLLQPDQ